MEELRVIQGDTLNVTLTICKPSELEISKVIFVCPSLAIEKELTPLNEEDLWGFVIPSTETENLWVGRWDFDITAITASSDKYTLIHNGQLFVDYKREEKAPVPPVPPRPGVIIGIGWTED